ncbi:MAG: hypothetical protein AAFY37_02325 [Pseudomonadota bacterium]
MRVSPLKIGLSALSVLALANCAGIEPAMSPPDTYRGDVTVAVEFIEPGKVGTRCAERGASPYGLSIANACASPELVTMPNPCKVFQGGRYAKILCHELGHVNGWAADHPGGSWVSNPIPQTIRRSFRAQAANEDRQTRGAGL